MAFFYKHNPKKFNYIPRYFDPDKEAWEQKKVEIPLPREKFELWDSNTNTMRVMNGKYEVFIGTSSADRDLKKINVTIK